MSTPKPTRLIQPKQSVSDWFSQIIERRETLWFFILKDLKVQYQNPFLGLLWSVIQPLIYFGIVLSMVHFSGRTSNTTELPFSLFLICGLAIWNFVTSSILGAINSVPSNAGIISKSFFPKIYLILSPLIKQTIDFSILIILILGLSYYLNQPPSIGFIAMAIVGFSLAFSTAFGWAAIATSLTVKNRHIRHLIPMLLYAMMFVLPVFYSVQNFESTVVQTAYQLNPIAGAMDCLRAGFHSAEMGVLTISSWFLQSAVWMIVGIVIFRKTERNLADKV